MVGTVGTLDCSLLLTFSAKNKVSLYTQTSPSSPLREVFEKIFNFHGIYA